MALRKRTTPGEDPDDRFLSVPLDPETEAAELDEAEPQPLAAVDPPVINGFAVDRTWSEDGRRPVLPPWLASPGTRRAAARWAAGHAAYTTRYHAVRAPLYALRVLLRAPVGLWKVLAACWAWVHVFEARPAQREARDAGRTAEYLRVVQERRERSRVRAVVVGLALVVLASSVATLVHLAPVVAGALGVVLVLALAQHGTPADRPLVGAATVTPRLRRLSAEVVERAIVAAKLASSGADIAFAQPIQRDGPGWLAVIDLPYGQQATEAVRRRPAVASGLDLPVNQVWPEPDRSSTRRLRLWVGDQDLSTAPSTPWPLVRRGTVDAFEPFRIGSTPKGEPVEVTPVFENFLIGARPRMGKTYAARLIAAGAALDPTVELWIYNLKGGGDWLPFRQVAHRLENGDSDEQIEQGLADMQALQAEQQRRYKVIEGLPPELCKDSKVTRRLANDRKLRLHPLVLVVEECQYWFEHAEYGKRFAELVGDLVRRGPAAGIIVILATQKPTSDAVPSQVSANISTRLALSVGSAGASNAILGDGKAKEGISALTLTRADKGVCVTVGLGDQDGLIVRTDLADTPAIATALARARAEREAAGLLTGLAAGEAPPDPAARRSLLDDVRQVLTGRDWMWSEDIADRLYELAPDAYEGLTAQHLGQRLAAIGLRTEQLNREGRDGRRAVRQGVTRQALEAL